MKKIIKKIVRIIAKAVSLLPLKYIVFESIPDLSDNTRAVFDEMVSRSINQKYKFIWLCSNPGSHDLKIKNVILIDQKDSLKVLYYTMRAKCLISCNRMLHSWGSYQKSYFLCHGAPIKAVNGYKVNGIIDYVIGQSEFVNDVVAHELGIEREKFIVTGAPRNDELLDAMNRTKVHQIFDNKYSKIAVWYPTFRQHAKSKITDAFFSLPIIHDEESAIKLNESAAQNNVLLVLKPHFSQDLSKIKKMSLSNLLFIDDSFFATHGMSSYQFVGGCDALITDYSSIYFDYLLCNKPIVAIWEDIDEYKNNRGFALDIDYYMKGASKIYNLNDFVAFINDLALDNDLLSNERKEINDIINYYQDSNSSVRVVDHIVNNLLNFPTV